jgi:hypothetical protein
MALKRPTMGLGRPSLRTANIQPISRTGLCEAPRGSSVAFSRRGASTMGRERKACSSAALASRPLAGDESGLAARAERLAQHPNEDTQIAPTLYGVASEAAVVVHPVMGRTRGKARAEEGNAGGPQPSSSISSLRRSRLMMIWSLTRPRRAASATRASHCSCTLRHGRRHI